MIISVDGNVYLGKTTFLSTLQQALSQESVIIEEYDTQINELENKSHHEKQKYYFGLEAERVKLAASCQQSLLLLDRSFLSILAHSYAMSRIEKIDYFTGTLNLWVEHVKQGCVLIPDWYLFFLQEHPQRQYKDVDEKGGEDILYDILYREEIDAFFQRVQREMKECASESLESVRRILFKIGAELSEVY